MKDQFAESALHVRTGCPEPHGPSPDGYGDDGELVCVIEAVLVAIDE